VKSLLKIKNRPSLKVLEVDVDVTPIMNMFIILIPFLVSMAVFSHLSILQFTLPPSAGKASGGPKSKDLKMTVLIRSNDFLLTLGETVLDSLPKLKGEFDLIKLKESLIIHRDSLKRKNDLILAIDDGIVFNEIVQTMDVCRVAGFEKIALSEGAGKAVNGE